MPPLLSFGTKILLKIKQINLIAVKELIENWSEKMLESIDLYRTIAKVPDYPKPDPIL